MNVYAHKQDLVTAANNRGLFDRLCKAIEIAYGWTKETDPKLTGQYALLHGCTNFPYICHTVGTDEFSGEPTVGDNELRFTGDAMLDLIFKKTKMLKIEDVYTDTSNLSEEEIGEMITTFNNTTGKSFWTKSDASRLKRVDPAIPEDGKKYRKVIFYDKMAGLDALHLECGSLVPPAVREHEFAVEVEAQEFKDMFYTKHVRKVEDVEQQKETFEPEDTEPTYIPNTGVMPSEDFVQVRFNNGKTEVAKGTVFNWSVDNNHDLEEWAIKEYFILPRTAKYNYHNGGHRPCGGHVEVLFRDGTTDSGSATHFTWGHHEQDRDIVGWLPTNNPKPRYRKRRQKPPVGKKSVVRVLYTTQQTYTFKNVVDVQVTEERVYIQYDREVTKGIKESVTTEIENKLVMAIIVEESKVENGKAYTVRDSFLRNIDGTWDYNGHDGTAVKNGKIMGRQFLSKQ
ncbi:ribonucleotide reductase [Escherichia phage ukendt]|uniref:Uncharacterized protein n=2 Tax=root TaxID=1 RepID=A0A6B9WM42_9CAUD|nr:ribonucleotide reductase [Escherichia phage ukendt]QHR64818.1 hypothetical protein ukendt_22 [Escherichia phage ukendt]